MTDVAPVITSIRYSRSVSRKQPREGDLRETKAHGKQVRMRQRVTDGPYRGSGISRNGRLCYEWVSYDEARQRGGEHLIPKEKNHD